MVVMMIPETADPILPDFARSSTRVANRLAVQINEPDVARSIDWAQGLMARGLVEEYALAATSLEDAYIRLTRDVSEEST